MGRREYPELPMVGVSGVVISEQRVLLVCRATEPAHGEWTIPGGLLEVGETLAEGVTRELLEETGLTVRVIELVEALERIFPNASQLDLPSVDLPPQQGSAPRSRPKPRYHFVILDYLCEVLEGEARASDEVSDLAFVHEEDLGRYNLTPAVTRVVRKAFAMARSRGMS